MIFDQIRGVKSLSPTQLEALLTRGTTTFSGVSVTPANAMTYAAVFACVRVLAESVGALPINVYERKAGGPKRIATEHPLYRLLHTDGPNDFQTPQEFVEWLMVCLALRGNAYAFQTRVRGELRELLPIAPGAVSPVMLDDGGTVVYDVTHKGGQKRYPASAIYHVKLFSLDGYRGLSPVGWQRETIGVGLAQQEHGARLFANSARPGGVLSTDKKMPPEAAKRLIGEVEEIVRGLENAGRTLVLGDGMKWQQIGMSNEDAQWLEARKFSRSEIAGIWRVPPHMIADLERATFSNIEQQDLSLLKHTLVPYLTRIEARGRKTLIGEDQRATHYLKFNQDALMRGDAKARAEALAIKLDRGVISPNEWRDLDDMNPREGGDVYLTPANFLIDGKPPPTADTPEAKPDDA